MTWLVREAIYWTLQHTATHCNTLQHTATRSFHEWHDSFVSVTGLNVYSATHCNTLQHSATHCNTLQHTAKRSWVSQDSTYIYTHTYSYNRTPSISTYIHINIHLHSHILQYLLTRMWAHNRTPSISTYIHTPMRKPSTQYIFSHMFLFLKNIYLFLMYVNFQQGISSSDYSEHFPFSNMKCLLKISSSEYSEHVLSEHD